MNAKKVNNILNNIEFMVVKIMPQIDATIAQATPLRSELIPEAAFTEAAFITPPVLPIRVIMAPESNRSHNPIITPAIVPASPQYNGIGVCVAMSFSTESQCRSTASFKRLKSITDPELFPRYLLIEATIDVNIVLPFPYTPSTRFVSVFLLKRQEVSSLKTLLN